MALFRRKNRRMPEPSAPTLPDYQICGFALHEMERLAAEKSAPPMPRPIAPEPDAGGGVPREPSAN